MATKQRKMKRAQRRRKMHIRKRVHGSAERPRLVVHRSLKHMYAGLVDDIRGVTLLGLTDKVLPAEGFELPEEGLDFRVGENKLPLTPKVAKAYRLGLAVAERAKALGVTSVVFDRNGLRYHGRVRAVAEGARKGGLEF